MFHQPQELILQNLIFGKNLPDIPFTVSKGVRQAFPWITGSGFDEQSLRGKHGPRKQYKIMFVGKAASRTDINLGYVLSGRTRRILEQMLSEVGIGEDQYHEIYQTNLLKTPPLKKGALRASWIKAQELILRMELLIARPKIVVGFGKEVVNWFLNTKQSLSALEYRFHDVVWDLRESVDEPLLPDSEFRFLLLPCMHPAALEYEQKDSDISRIRETFKILGLAISGKGRVKRFEDYKYDVIRDYESLEKICQEGLAHPSHRNLVAVDAEWQGEHPQNAGAYLRCVQFCWAPEKAFVLHLTDTRGNPDFVGSDGRKGPQAIQEAFRLIERTFEENNLRVCGFYFQADLEWMAYFGLDLVPFYEPADSPEECRDKGGFALELAVAAVDEMAQIELDAVRARFTDYPPYSHVLEDFKTAAKAGDVSVLGKLKEDPNWWQIVDNGYGWMPDEVLYPYGAADVDVTLRGAIAIEPQLDADKFGNNCWRPYWCALSANLVAAEIMQTGLPFDPRQCLRMAVPYYRKYHEMLDQLRRELRWPDFNIKSHPQTMQALYGTDYGGKVDDTGRRISTRPPGARTFNLQPVLTNDSRSPQPWETIAALGQEHMHTPGTNFKTISVMLNDPEGVPVRRFNPETRRMEVMRVPAMPSLTIVRDLRTIGQLCANYTGSFVRMPDGRFILEGGLAFKVCDDGYVRPFVSQAKETGRWSLSRPNLQAIPKRKEARYKTILGEEYPGPVRSMFRAPPGYCLLEVDYKTAELFMLAVASEDETLWDHCMRSLLPSDHPDYVDVHSTVAVQGFKLPCPATKAGLSSVGKGYLRDVAKCYAEGTLIATDRGWIPIEKIVKHSLTGVKKKTPVTDENRLPIRLESGHRESLVDYIAVSDVGKQECFEIRSKLGYTLTATRDHKTFVIRDGDCLKLPTSQIRPGDRIVIRPTRGSEHKRKLPDRLNTLFCMALRKNALSSEDYELLGLFISSALMAVISTNSTHTIHLRFPFAICRESVMRMAALLGKVTDGAIRVSGEGRSFIFKASAGVSDLLVYLHNQKFVAVPPFVFSMHRDDAAAILTGMLLPPSRGGRAWPRIVDRVNGDPVYEFVEFSAGVQKLMLSLGMITRRVGNRLLEPADLKAAQWWGQIFDAKKSRTPIPSTLPNWLAEVYPDLAKKFQLPSFSDESLTLRHILEKKLKNMRLDALDHMQLIDLIHSQIFLDQVESVTPIGARQVYDVQVEETYYNAVVANGIVSSNSIVFGWAYGRQAPAIVIQAKEEGIEVELAEAETVINSLYQLYPAAARYLEEAAARVKHGFLCTPMGRFRRCPNSDDPKKLAGYGREFKNSPIQGGVADVVNLAGRNLRKLRKEKNANFRIALQVHDAYIFLVPCQELVRCWREVIKPAMSTMVPIVPYRLDGTLDDSVPPRHLAVDAEVFFRWSVSPTDDELAEAGISLADLH
ncbi:MAG: hypothetical protein KatS3mg109_0161 [Pirellulaceae bacterium]|nr:MAG: hypothetical protein KatS3mg109_0161 [Pirellulaceae bacterium]